MKKIFFSTLLFFSFGCLLASEIHSDSVRQELARILSDPATEPKQRFYEAVGYMEKELPLSERLLCYQTLFRGYCAQMKSEELQNTLMARLHVYLGTCYVTLQQEDAAGMQYDSAYYYIQQTVLDSYEKALVYQIYADMQIRNGSVEEGHEHYWKAIGIWERVGNAEVKQSYCYYQLATGYYQTGDIEGMEKVVNNMKLLSESTSDKRVSYDYYSVCSVYYTMLSQAHPEVQRYQDSIAYYSLQSIGIIEKMSFDEMRSAQLKPVWNYYNHAVFYDPDEGEPVVDSIEKYLNLAEKMMLALNYQGWERDECLVSIRDERAWLYYHKKQYRKAEQEMLETIQLIDSVDRYSPNSVVIEREQAYRFLVDLYEEMGDFSAALQYQKRLNETTKQRYDSEKQKAIHQLLVQYEVEQQDCAISRLTLKNEAARKIMWMIVGLCVLLLLFLVSVSILYFLRKKNLQQQVYENTLEAENVKQELFYRTQEMDLLRIEYNRLQELSEKNQEYAEKYKSDLLLIRQRLEEAPTRTLVLNLMELVRQSGLTRNTKQKYLELLDKLDTADLDGIFAAAKQRLTTLDMKYIVCFLANMKADDIADLFLISIDSVYSVRHRVRRKFDKQSTLPF